MNESEALLQDDPADAPAASAVAPDRDPWTRDTLQQLLQRESQRAKQYFEQHLEPRRAQAIEYYDGAPFGNEEDGRSQVVAMELRDTINAVLPSLARMFLGGERIVEFCPRSQEDEAAARERTDYVQLIVREDNPGFRLIYLAMKEALKCDYSVLKWWWDDSRTVVRETYHGQTRAQAESLAAGADVTEAAFAEDGQIPRPDGYLDPDLPETPMPGPEGAPPAPEMPPPSETIPTYRVSLTRETRVSRARYDLVPANEFYVDPEAKIMSEASYVGHIRPMTRSQIIALGYDPALLEEHGGTDFSWQTSEEAQARHPEQPGRYTENVNPDLEKTDYGEHFVLADTDEDGIAELLRICTLGPELFPVRIEAATERPFAVLSADLEAYQLFGTGFFPLLRDLQLIKSSILRAVLDSLRSSIDPRTAVNEDTVNLDDLLNQELGGIVRVEGLPGEQIKVLDVPFAGQAGLQVLDYLDQIGERRTGQTKGSQGLDADAMQSTTKMAIAAQMSAAQQRIELVARIFAETGIKDLFAGLQRLVMRHQDIPRMVRLNNRWTSVDPQTWDAPLDTTINLMLGAGPPEERLVRLMGVLEKQEAYLEKLGPSELVDYRKLRYTLAKSIELGGYGDPSLYFGDIPEGWAPTPPPPKPEPAEILAQTKMAEIAARKETDLAKIALDREKMQVTEETRRMKIEADMRLWALELEAKHQIQVNEAQLQQQIEAMRQRTAVAVAAAKQPVAPPPREGASPA